MPVARYELFHGLAEAHALDADADVKPALGAAIQTDSVVALLAVGAVVEAAVGTCDRQPEGPYVLDGELPAVG